MGDSRFGENDVKQTHRNDCLRAQTYAKVNTCEMQKDNCLLTTTLSLRRQRKGGLAGWRLSLGKCRKLPPLPLTSTDNLLGARAFPALSHCCMDATIRTITPRLLGGAAALYACPSSWTAASANIFMLPPPGHLLVGSSKMCSSSGIPNLMSLVQQLRSLIALHWLVLP